MTDRRWVLAAVTASVLTALVALWLRFESDQVPPSAAIRKIAVDNAAQPATVLTVR